MNAPLELDLNMTLLKPQLLSIKFTGELRALFKVLQIPFNPMLC